ncbi:MAG: sulfur carrier protein ThiS [Gammaproteobacteria bacterium]|nr:sulfur carrier protein ThiS [Gammaproteobacteria bacterium]
MKIQLNGKCRELRDGETVCGLLCRLDLAGRRVAVEVNGTVVPKSEHTRHQLSEGDRVELIGAIGGG